MDSTPDSDAGHDGSPIDQKSHCNGDVAGDVPVTGKEGRTSPGCCAGRICKKTRCQHVEPLSCWVTLAAAFWVNTMVAAIEVGFPLLYDPLRDKYNASRASVGTSLSLMISVGSVCALVSAPFINMFGVRPVAFVGCAVQTTGLLLCTFAPTMFTFHLFYGVISGLGYGLIYIPSLTIVQQKFTHNRGLATGVALLGFTNGTILAPILMEYLLRTYGLSGSLLLQTAVHAHNFIFVFAFKSPKEYRSVDDSKASDDSSKDENLRNGDQCEKTEKEARPKRNAVKLFWKNLINFGICKDVKFVLYIVVRLCWFFSRFCLNVHIVSYASQLGISLTKASYLPSVMGVCNLVTRSFSSIVLNIRRLNKELYFSLGLLCIAVGSFLAATAEGYSYLLGAMILMGFNEGISTTSQSLVLVNLIGIQAFHKAMAVVEIATIPASLAAGPFSGWLVDISGEYFATFLLSGVAGLLAMSVFLVITLMLYLQKTKTKQDRGDDSMVIDPQELVPLETNKENGVSVA